MEDILTITLEPAEVSAPKNSNQYERPAWVNLFQMADIAIGISDLFCATRIIGAYTPAISQTDSTMLKDSNRTGVGWNGEVSAHQKESLGRFNLLVRVILASPDYFEGKQKRIRTRFNFSNNQLQLTCVQPTEHDDRSTKFVLRTH
jgi:hypothetical protein